MSFFHSFSVLIMFFTIFSPKHLLISSTPSSLHDVRNYPRVHTEIRENDEDGKDGDITDIMNYDSQTLCAGCILEQFASSNTKNQIAEELGQLYNITPHEITLPNFGPESYCNPSTDKKNIQCKHLEKAVYAGYLDFQYNENWPFVQRQLEYARKYPKYQAYWPETSPKAADITNIAIPLFQNLIHSTALKKVIRSKKLAKDFMVSSWWFKKLLSEKLLAIGLSATCFRFTDFYQVAKDAEYFCNRHFSVEECFLIESKLDAILEKLSGMFLHMYEESISLHPTPEIEFEMQFVKRYLALINDQVEKSHNPKIKKKPQRSVRPKGFFDFFKPAKPSYMHAPAACLSKFLLLDGIRLNKYRLYLDAVDTLTDAIKMDASNTIAYIERAYAYFELDKINYSISDYEKAQKLLLQQGGVQKGLFNWLFGSPEIQYSKGFCVGATQGVTVAVTDFVPSVFCCSRGILHALWATASPPIETSKAFIDHCYVLTEYLAKNTTQEQLDSTVSELKILLINWAKLSDYERGKQTGYVVGKYGLDIFLCTTTVKQMQRLKQLNTMLTLETCTISRWKKASILKESKKFATARSSISKVAKSDKIVPANSNIIPQVMQKKHAWDKVLTLTGNHEKDFKKVLEFLEKHNVKKASKLVDEAPFIKGSTKVLRQDYEMTINNNVIRATFEKNKDTAETLLKNAWISES